MNKPCFSIEFAFVWNALAVEELAELLGRLTTSELSILVIPEQRF